MENLVNKLNFNINGEAASTDLESGEVTLATNHLAMFLQFDES